jgi:hypothetical protein
MSPLLDPIIFAALLSVIPFWSYFDLQPMTTRWQRIGNPLINRL